MTVPNAFTQEVLHYYRLSHWLLLRRVAWEGFLAPMNESADPTNKVTDRIVVIAIFMREFADPVNEFADPVNEFADPVNEFADPVNEFANPVNEFADPVNEFANPVNEFANPEIKGVDPILAIAPVEPQPFAGVTAMAISLYESSDFTLFLLRSPLLETHHWAGRLLDKELGGAFHDGNARWQDWRSHFAVVN
jgi:hypothetical protein